MRCLRRDVLSRTRAVQTVESQAWLCIVDHLVDAVGGVAGWNLPRRAGLDIAQRVVAVGTDDALHRERVRRTRGLHPVYKVGRGCVPDLV